MIPTTPSAPTTTWMQRTPKPSHPPCILSPSLMTMKIISFNGCSLMQFDKFRRIIRTLRHHKPDIILLQEITPPSTSPNLYHMQTLWQTIWQGDVYISPLVATLISPSYKSKLIGISLDDRVMDVSIEHPKLSTIAIRNIYAPAHENCHQSFWASIPPLSPNTMIVGGDFNCTL